MCVKSEVLKLDIDVDENVFQVVNLQSIYKIRPRIATQPKVESLQVRELNFLMSIFLLQRVSPSVVRAPSHENQKLCQGSEDMVASGDCVLLTNYFGRSRGVTWNACDSASFQSVAVHGLKGA